MLHSRSAETFFKNSHVSCGTLILNVFIFSMLLSFIDARVKFIIRIDYSAGVLRYQPFKRILLWYMAIGSILQLRDYLISTAFLYRAMIIRDL